MFNFKYNFIFQTRIENQFTYLAIHISFWLCGLVLWGPNQQITASNTGSLDLTQGLETDGDIIPGNMPDMPDMPGMREGGMPNGLGSKGSEDIRILSISDSCSRLVLARLFWNQILTWGGEMRCLVQERGGRGHTPESPSAWAPHWTLPSQRWTSTASLCTSSPRHSAGRWWRGSSASCWVCASSANIWQDPPGAWGSDL